MVVAVAKAFLELGRGVRTIREKGLFCDMMKELSNECLVGGRGVGSVIGHVAGALDIDTIAVVRFEDGIIVDRLAAFLLAPAPDRVVLLETESEGIDR